MRNAVATCQPPFMSSTPVVISKGHQTIATVDENSEVKRKIKSNAKVVVTKKSRKTSLKNDAKCDKRRKSNNSRNVKPSIEKARKEIIPETVSSQF